MMLFECSQSSIPMTYLQVQDMFYYSINEMKKTKQIKNLLFSCKNQDTF